MGQFGGPLLLPADVPDQEHPYVATIDLAALPAGSTDLPLPPDGRLLLFVFPEDDGCCGDIGSVVYVPEGTPVVERDMHTTWYSTVDEYREYMEQFPQGPMHAAVDVSLPHYCDEDFSDDLRWEADWPPHSEELLKLVREAQNDIGDWGTFQLGGFASEEVADLHDPVESIVEAAKTAVAKGKVDFAVSEDPADWVLLADWHVDVDGWEGMSVHWAVQRRDLEERRFERVFVSRYWNP
ncbi:DUF1963 domain-containing protein [Lentzea sp.]|uniref:DUF1963 domain-containing protein n=1 Tax=Lentzea sp. TaxID=56099 RepID=UPI002ED31A6E